MAADKCQAADQAAARAAEQERAVTSTTVKHPTAGTKDQDQAVLTATAALTTPTTQIMAKKMPRRRTSATAPSSSTPASATILHQAEEGQELYADSMSAIAAKEADAAHPAPTRSPPITASTLAELAVPVPVLQFWATTKNFRKHAGRYHTSKDCQGDIAAASMKLYAEPELQMRKLKFCLLCKPILGSRSL